MGDLKLFNLSAKKFYKLFEKLPVEEQKEFIRLIEIDSEENEES